MVGLDLPRRLGCYRAALLLRTLFPALLTPGSFGLALAALKKRPNLTIPQITYTLVTVYPVFAIVEDENPPAYEPVSLHEEQNGNEAARAARPTGGNAETVTSSLRAVTRLLYAVGGFKGFFRGIVFFAIQFIMAVVLASIFISALGPAMHPIATLLTCLTLVQFSAAWVHIVMTYSSPVSHFSRLPSFKRAFDASWQALTLNWAAVEILSWVPLALSKALNLTIPDIKLGDETDITDVSANDIWKVVVIAVCFIAVFVLLVIPSSVILIRVQASLLPVEDEPIVPFDRSFEGRIEPQVVGGRGYATIADAWATYSKAGWRRLCILYIKIGLVSIATYMVVSAVILAEVLLIVEKGTKGGDGEL